MPRIFGFIIAGKFSRGPHRGGGEAVNSAQRDRTRALQLMVQAMPAIKTEPRHDEIGGYWMAMARMLLSNRGFNDAWRLGYLTNLNELPDYDKGQFHDYSTTGAPVNRDGNPIFHYEPKTWDAAQTDGQRWRFALAQAAQNDPHRQNDARYELAEFLQNQFGVQTMAYYSTFFGRLQDEDVSGDDAAADQSPIASTEADKQKSADAQDTAAKDQDAKDEVEAKSTTEKSGAWALSTLSDDETIARLANGIRRFKLPAEFDFIRIYRQIADEPQTGHGEDALGELATFRKSPSIFAGRGRLAP